MKEIIIKTQKELDALTRIKKDESVEIVGEGLKLNANIEVFGFLKVSKKVEMSWSTFYLVARESSRVEAWASSVSWVYSTSVSVKLFGWAVSYKMFSGKGNITKERDTATIIEVPEQVDN